MTSENAVEAINTAKIFDVEIEQGEVISLLETDKPGTENNA